MPALCQSRSISRKGKFRNAFPGAVAVGPQVQARAHGPKRCKTGLQLGQQAPGLGGVYFVLNGDVRLQLLLVLRR